VPAPQAVSLQLKKSFVLCVSQFPLRIDKMRSAKAIYPND